ncbi:MAG TPA: TaqI-like C-terminal specificity domain-containing protein [Candidatus Aminicenantes bacterium]|nr:TaqI-like C-terminal specificity domain-containing protein [Candidatus Aminicenantes bacterium]
MSKTFDQGKDEVAKLCRFFETNEPEFRAAGVKEAHIRQQLIDPFFISLGWDVRNAAMIAPQYREVVPEDSLEIEGRQKAPDYTFRVGAQPKFFAEAKKCGVNINLDPGPAYQLRRYGFSARVALSILTDFEELGVYDCGPRPKPGEKASYSRIQYFRAEEYPDRFRELWDVFSREAVWSGAFDQYAASKRKRGTSEVDSEFLKEIEGWRDVLARNIALRNPGLSLDDLNLAVQLTIDRIVFLRMAEDRGIEPFEQLLKLCERREIYAHFIRVLCRKADDKYNSGLFHFEREPGVAEAPDRLTPCLKIDDKAIKPVLQSLYFEYGSPYQFGVMPVEILGTVYERFLGKVIRLTEGHQAKIEEKPEVRKAGGVYYTPAYIVDYIVKNTVGKKIEGRSPAQLAGGKSGPPLRVLDMACGSGSFLLGAYQRLLDHSLTWYQDHKPDSRKKAVYQDSRKGDWRLTIEEKKRILTTHVFGVDIDPQAVEVTKLSLLLKVLEGETDQTFDDQMKLFQTRALPNLSNNIKCGNSLIGPDYFSGRLIPDPEELKRVNPFDWNAGFPEAMKAGGFDCVIGNPPYVRQESLGPQFKEYAQKSFASYAGTADLYTYFIEKAHLLLVKGGLFGMICSNKFMRANYGNALRSFISKRTTIEQIVDFGELPVFEGAATFPAIILAANIAPKEQKFIYAPIKRLDFQSLEKEVKEIGNTLDERSLTGDNWTLAKAEEIEVFEKIKKIGIPLGEYVKGNIYRGILTGLNEAFVIDKATRDRLIKEDRKSTEIIKPFVVGDDIRRYRIDSKDNYLICIPKGWTRSKAGIIKNADAWNWISGNYHSVAKHLEPYKEKAEKRCDKGEYWWELRACDYYDEIEKPKIIWPEIAKENRFSIDNGEYYLNKTCFFTPFNDKYLLGILNSKLIWYYLKKICSVLGDAEKGGRLLQQKIYLETLPIKDRSNMNLSQKKQAEKLINHVESQLALNLQKCRSDNEKRKIIQRQIEATDREIDQLVYELYGLTKEEIRIVEGETK